jgi:hypothetical protein
LEPNAHRWTPELGTKAPSAEAMKLMQVTTDEVDASIETDAYPNELGDLIWLPYKQGAALMNGMKYVDCCSFGFRFLYFYPEPAQLLERLAALEQEGKAHDDVRRFVALYELACKEATPWEQETESAEPEDETEDAIEEPQEVDELLGEKVEFGDPNLMAPSRRPVPGDFHREPVIILHP